MSMTYSAAGFAQTTIGASNEWRSPWYRSIAAAAGFMMSVAHATAAELPTYEVIGFPITPHQLVVLGPPNAEQRLPTFTVTMAGMPASPHQIAVLTPRQRALDEQIVSGGPRATAQAGFSPAVAGEKTR
jgi:hypothetical protein